jgi:predicted PurR-regulated permease PerM
MYTAAFSNQVWNVRAMNLLNYLFLAAAHLKLHPLLALGVLVFAEHTLGVWGLLVAVPMAVFFSEYIIKRNSMTMDEDNKYRALPSVPS